MVNANTSTPQMSPPSAQAVVAQLWHNASLDATALQRLHLSGSEPALPSSFAVGTALQAALGAAALAVTEVAIQRGAAAPSASLDTLDVVRESACRFTLDGRTPAMWDKLSGLYRCGVDGRWVRIHANFAHHRDGVLALLNLPTGSDTERSTVQTALGSWSAEGFEKAAAERGLVVAVVRSPAEWAAHPQARAVAAEPLLRIEQVGNAPPRRWPGGAAGPGTHAPLAGLRVLELTRILAGPVAGRTLAAHGADVLLVNGPHLPNIEAVAETSQGKLSTLLDLRTSLDRARLQDLVREADVFLQGYRPGALAMRGFGVDELSALRPGIVVASLSAYGTQGPWAGRRGFDSLVQSATGLNLAEAQALGRHEPTALPLQALDYGAGYLLAFGTLAALLRQRREGGSWQVQVSLAGVRHWLESLGRLPDATSAPKLDIEAALEANPSGFGLLHSVPHAALIDGQRVVWRRPSMPPGSHAPLWPKELPPRTC